ncbi:MAG TPA: GNAT family N-acetyltransferase [Candidatus Binataceae bacterium]|nr:GNAT family N-acetyltransferase [Candidatus Binataceae bacterium]
MPFSDFCPPLAADPAAGAHLLAHLAEHPQAAGGVEVRGSAAVSPWQLSTCFENWTLDLRRPLSAVERELGGVLRRKLNRNLRHAMVSGISIARGSAATDAQHFCELQFDARRRLGLPSQPASFFRLAHSIFAPSGAFEVWLARMSGRVVGGLVLLRAGGQLYEKWSARAADAPFGAAHLLLWSVIEEFAGKAEMLDLGRADVRNQGLGQFKKAIGAVAAPLPYSFFPRSPRTVSSEAPGAMQRVLSTLWRRIPSPASRLLGSAIYGYLA